MSTALVSAIIPTYNRADLVCRAIDSVLGQTYANIDAVIVDDGSTDNTAELIEGRYGKNDRVRYIRTVNSGVSRARNIGIRACHGDFVAFLDSDDYWLPWKTELQIKCLARAPHAGMIWTNMASVHPDGRILNPAYLRSMYGAYSRLSREKISLFDSPTKIMASELAIIGFERDIELSSGNIFSQMILGNLVHTSTCMLRRERLDRVSGFREDLKVTGEDYDFHLRTCREGPVSFVDVASIGYTVGASDQLTSPAFAVQMAQNSLRTIEPILKESATLINLPDGAIPRMLSTTHGWVADTLIDTGKNAEARIHAKLSIHYYPWRLRPYLQLLVTQLSDQNLLRFRLLYRSIKTIFKRLQVALH